MIDTKDNLAYVNQEYTQLAIMIIGLALFGWAAIYVLSNRPAKLIKNVAAAAKQVAGGNYQINLPETSKEKEVHELIDSFKEMTIKLEKLESLRTELLAGITHELKTPVSSMSGLLQALKEGVVSGEEAKEFLTISLNETEKMQTMVEDLLAFNQFATNTVPINKKLQNINEIVEEAVTSWKITHQLEKIIIKVSKLTNPVEIISIQNVFNKL
ncbi:HAMP domain-containing sensor histidine kinase [Pseudogracilibacillus sp. SO30301A]|uniref:HAMP domain-containing sensor histidine kinase n=1 Tax=Pseudogracilibacillus sp. SO30301A TaxID=3098291 RepID=UPI00300E2921